MGRILPILFLLVPPLLGACGEPTNPQQRLRLAAPLVERAAGEDGGDAVLIQARGPCRLVLLGEGLGNESLRSELTRRVLPAGRAVRLQWHITVRAAAAEVAGSPTDEDAAQGRTEPHEVVLAYGFDDEGGRLARTFIWTRPGLERTFRHVLPPAARPEPVPFGSAMELDLVVVGDLKSKDLKFTTRGAFTVVEFRDPVPQDRITPVRLILLVESP